jgi:putative ABC transport system substrate-binding protein
VSNRRKLIVALSASALAGPLSSFAQQQGKVWHIGYLSARSRPDSLESDFRGAPFLHGLRELGYVEGKNVSIEWRFANGATERLQGYADELSQLNVDVIVTENTTATHAAQKATSTIPIVMGSSNDPVRSGFVKTLAHPGANITGFTSMSSDVGTKQLEMLRDMVPKLSHVAVMFNPVNPGNRSIVKSVQEAANSIHAKILPLEARTAPEIEKAFSAMARGKVGAVIVARDSIFNQQARQIAELAMKYRLPSACGYRENAEAGSIISYGPSTADMFRSVASHVDRIVKGAKPADLPVQQPTKFELVINGKTAKALGLKIPQSLLITADKVIE